MLRRRAQFASTCVLAMLLVLGGPLVAQDAPSIDAGNLLDELRTSTIPVPVGTTTSADANEIQSSIWCPDIVDEETRALCWRAYRARLEYYERGLEHRSRVFWWQHVSTRIIFGVVLLLVAAGILFAWMQFNHDLGKGGGASTQAGHTVELSTGGVKVSSPVLGVIILTLSLAFFYLYLIYVYPIAEIF